ncbi:alpha/beta fold hydrolase [Cesiribacter andamanensis]|uniref:Alpha/beta hydrolase family protein n=1 Tax=Cesiribacter andamanensis AMV16 TaxID=1279009 RepID=M7NT10_9BACT|nr:alpha/beta fold hydrolase [Cesiribacter andamanensis]EMR01624.1 Alpha/beta hydrolase family protein [Cesiribacter andamanensis AMV16]
MHTNTSSRPFTSESHFVAVGQQRLHLKRFTAAPGSSSEGASPGQPVFLVHGSIENGQIFYSASGKGLAPWLAGRGYDVFVADLRGRGNSSPRVSARAGWGLREILEEDFPAMLQEIVRLRGGLPQHWMGHSWGGVLLLAYLARWQAPAPVSSLSFFGTKRRLGVWNPKKALMVDGAWSAMGEALTRLYGYLPARKWKMGSDDESARSYRETHRWVVEKEWRDSRDGFDYGQALRQQALPPALYLTGASDTVLGHPIDVHRLMQETGIDQPNQLVVAGKATGFRHDYGHIDLLTHADAPADVYPRVAAWLEDNRPGQG